jgi:hypothetical protein
MLNSYICKNLTKKIRTHLICTNLAQLRYIFPNLFIFQVFAASSVAKSFIHSALNFS